jgi:hypothetical protein
MTYEEYDELLDQLYPEVKIGYSTFLVSTILKELDPIAYEVGKDDCESAFEEMDESLEVEGGWSK